MKLAKRITVVVAILCAVLVGLDSGYSYWLYHLPSDKKTEAFFIAHKSDLASLIATVQQSPALEFVDAGWVGYGTNATDLAHVECARLLKKIGAQFLRSGDGAIEIYFWGRGCAICHDSYKGYAYIKPDAPMVRHSTIVRSLADKALPPGKYAPIGDGSYILPLGDNWYIFRWECG